MGDCPGVGSHGAWQRVPGIPALREDYKFGDSLGYAGPRLQRERENGPCD